MRRYVIIAAIVVLTVVTARSQLVYEVPKNRAGGVEFYSSNYGIFGLNVATATSGFRYPRTSGNPYLFGSGLWFGAQKRVGPTLSPLTFVTYDLAGSESWASPGEHDPSPDAALPIIHNSLDYDRVTGRYTGKGSRPDWPLWVRPSMLTSAMYPGIFEPVNGRRSNQGGGYASPAFVAGADEQIFTRFHDGDISRYKPGEALLAGFPLGLQFQQNIFSWSQGPYQSMVLLQHQIINTSADTLHNCVIGQVSDPDLGNSMNDHIRFFNERPELRAAYAWTDDEGSPYGVLGMALVEAPTTNAGGFIDNSTRSMYKQMGRVGSYQTWGVDIEPANSRQRYEIMTRGIGTEEQGPMDIRTFLASTPFSMRPGDTAYFTVVYMVVDRQPDPSVPAEESMLERMITSVTADYYDRGIFISPASAPLMQGAAADISLAAMPSPAGDHVTLRMVLAEPSAVTVRLTSSLGETVMLRSLDALPAGMHNELIDVAGLPAGMYFATVESAGRIGTARFILAR